MKPPHPRKPQPSAGTGGAPLMIGAGVAVALCGAVWASLHAAALLGGPEAPPGDPLRVALTLAGDPALWSPQATAAAVVLAVLSAACAVGIAVARARSRRARSRVDHAAQHLGRGADVARLTRRGAARIARGCGTVGEGLPLGRFVGGGGQAVGSVEDVSLVIAGTRAGKTSSLVIPGAMAAPGALVVTSNKRDVVDTLGGARSARGRVWVFDPQAIVGEPATWWWDPLAYVGDSPVRAGRVAAHFAAAARSPGAKTDAFFDAQGAALLAGLLLAAAVAERPVTDVHQWLHSPGDMAPVDALRAAGLTAQAMETESKMLLDPRTRDGIFATAQGYAACLSNPAIRAWFTRTGANDDRPQFRPHDFVRSSDTLLSLSREGGGSAAPLLAAMTAAVLEAAEEHATASAGGRLPVPLVVILDEAANVCRIADLPDTYSHYGSRGILLTTVLQSWAQGVEAWGREGMAKLAGAANILIYLGGVSDTDFLRSLSERVGDYDRVVTSVSRAQGRTSQTRQVGRDRVLTVDALSAWPTGRALVLASGCRPALVRTVPWWDGPHAAAITASVSAARA